MPLEINLAGTGGIKFIGTLFTVTIQEDGQVYSTGGYGIHPEKGTGLSESGLVLSGGEIKLRGPGFDTPDVVISRPEAGVLKVDGTLKVTGEVDENAV